MKKKMLSIVATILCLMTVMQVTAFADTATSVQTGPTMKLLTWVATKKHSLTPGGGNPKGSKCYVFFSNYGNIPSSMASDNNRELEIFLMEDDLLNSDDTVKCYNGKFSGRKLSSMSLSFTTTSGEIEPEGTAEMYLDCKLYRTTNKNLKDPANGTSAGRLFNYQIGINS